MSPLVVPVVELRRHTAARRRWQAEVPAGDLVPGAAHRLAEASAPVEGGELTVGEAALSGDVPVRLELVMESLPDAVVVTGHVEAAWTAPCHRCAEPLNGPLAVQVREVFESRPTEGESYPLGQESLDLAPMVREALLLELPLLARCPLEDQDPCPLSGYSASQWAGVTGAADPRWSVLDEIHFDEPTDGG